MRKLHQIAAACAIGAAVVAGNAMAQAAAAKEETGKDIAFDCSKGNCLACHGMPTVCRTPSPPACTARRSSR